MVIICFKVSVKFEIVKVFDNRTDLCEFTGMINRQLNIRNAPTKSRELDSAVVFGLPAEHNKHEHTQHCRMQTTILFQ